MPFGTNRWIPCQTTNLAISDPKDARFTANTQILTRRCKFTRGPKYDTFNIQPAKWVTWTIGKTLLPPLHTGDGLGTLPMSIPSAVGGQHRP
jgi:hypothetical protein